MTFEDRVQRDLTARVAEVNLQGDVDGVRERAVRRARRQRVLRAGVVVVLVAGAGATGFGLGRSSGSDGTARVADAPAATSTPVATSPPTAPPADVDAGPVTTLAPPRPGGEATDAVSSSDGGALRYGWGYEMGGPGTLIIERVTDGGLTVRVSRWTWDAGQMWSGYAPDSPWQPAPWCSPSGELRVGVAGDGVIDVAHASWFDQPYQGLAVNVFAMGRADGVPLRVVVAQVPADVTGAGVVYPDGSSDDVSPVDGVVLLVVPGGGDPGALELRLDRDGAPSVVTADSLGGPADREFYEGCTPPPPPLPAAGEQPADVAGSEAAVRAAMVGLFSPESTIEERLAYVDDPAGLEAAFDDVRSGPYGEIAGSATHAIVELVFTSPDEAWFRYDLETPISTFRNRYGRAVLVDGAWKIVRDVVCQDLSLAGVTCTSPSPFGAGPIQPPGAEGWYEQFYVDESFLEGPTPPELAD